ncbi:MAG: flagellar motor stator protein MotA, partial [Ignavibacteria bacterium]|nr:flagellar motor stator protein MotA [Ignavibacteria bacterium]
MFTIIGFVVVALSVIIGFMFAGGNPILLIQIPEFITIIGSAIGSILIASPLSLIKKIVAEIPAMFKGHGFSKQEYLELLKSFNDLFLLAQRDGLLAIEKHVENPKESDILSMSKKFV